jgi:hypothetical protein
MTFQKKNYTQPQLVVHGNVETITQQGGGNKIDLPFGTVVSPNATIGDVTGS